MKKWFSWFSEILFPVLFFNFFSYFVSQSSFFLLAPHLSLLFTTHSVIDIFTLPFSLQHILAPLSVFHSVNVKHEFLKEADVPDWPQQGSTAILVKTTTISGRHSVVQIFILIGAQTVMNDLRWANSTARFAGLRLVLVALDGNTVKQRQLQNK